MTNSISAQGTKYNMNRPNTPFAPKTKYCGLLMFSQMPSRASRPIHSLHKDLQDWSAYCMPPGFLELNVSFPSLGHCDTPSLYHRSSFSGIHETCLWTCHSPSADGDYASFSFVFPGLSNPAAYITDHKWSWFNGWTGCVLSYAQSFLLPIT